DEDSLEFLDGLGYGFQEENQLLLIGPLYSEADLICLVEMFEDGTILLTPGKDYEEFFDWGEEVQKIEMLYAAGTKYEEIVEYVNDEILDDGYFYHHG